MQGHQEAGSACGHDQCAAKGHRALRVQHCGCYCHSVRCSPAASAAAATSLSAMSSKTRILPGHWMKATVMHW